MEQLAMRGRAPGKEAWSGRIARGRKGGIVGKIIKCRKECRFRIILIKKMGNNEEKLLKSNIFCGKIILIIYAFLRLDCINIDAANCEQIRIHTQTIRVRIRNWKITSFSGAICIIKNDASSVLRRFGRLKS